MKNLYLYPMSAPATIRVVELESAKDFKRRVEDLQEGEVVLAHGYCTLCKAVTYYVRDYNMDGCSHICSKCGERFCFQHGDERYIDMDDIKDANLSIYNVSVPEKAKELVAHLNSIPVQKAILKKALDEFLEAKKAEAGVLNEELRILGLLQEKKHIAE